MSVKLDASSKPSAWSSFFGAEKQYEHDYEQKIRDLQTKRDQAHCEKKSQVTVLGAGPAGLIRAVEAILLGHPTTIIEKRSENQQGRSHTVRLESDTIEYLEPFGVIDYLQKEEKIYYTKGQSELHVRLADLEEALKAVLNRILTNDDRILYNRSVEAIGQNGEDKVILKLKDKEGLEELLSTPVDALVIAEGAHSKTSELLGIRRIEVLPATTMISALFKERETDFSSIEATLHTLKEKLQDTGSKMYYFFQFLIELCSGEHILNPDRTLLAAVAFETPGQNYLGMALKSTENDEIKQLNREINAYVALLKADPQRKDRLEIESRKSKTEHILEDKLTHWAHVAFFWANTLQIIAFLFGQRSFSELRYNLASWKPLQADRISLLEVSSDKAEVVSTEKGNTSVLLCGDAAATVDPTTGLGANTAIKTAAFFKKFLSARDRGADKEMLHHSYRNDMSIPIEEGHKQSSEIRKVLIPDMPDLSRALA